MLIEFFIIISFPFPSLAWEAGLANLLQTNFFPLLGEFKMPKIFTFLTSQKKKQFSLLLLGCFIYNRIFLGSKANCPRIKTVRGMTANIFKRRLNFCLKEPEPLKVHCHDTDYLI